MKLKLVGGSVYTIPIDITLTCKHIQIAYANTESPLHLRRIKRNRIFDRNAKFLEHYTCIGYEEWSHDNMDIELHWFVPRVDLNKCRCDVAE